MSTTKDNIMTAELKAWEEYRSKMFQFSQQPIAGRAKWWFRGQANFDHMLEPTIDRMTPCKNDTKREQMIEQLLSTYRMETIVAGLADKLPDGDAFELLARHHGLKSPFLDWTTSPYVAAFFAFQNADPSSAPNVAIFALNRSQIPQGVLESEGKRTRAAIELVDDPELIRFNRRAGQQRGVFMRRSTIKKSVETLLGRALFKFKLPASERNAALQDLDLMLLNPTTLFNDLDGAALTANWRIPKVL